jgi:ABC-type multidrug transport system fused ATPase/permease subunit
VLLVWGAGAVGDGHITAGTLVSFAAGLALAQRPLSGLAEAGSLARRATGALVRVETLLSEPRRAWSAHLPQGPVGIDVQGAGLCDVVGPVDLHITEGSFVALVGATGSGKTTLLRWIAGLSAPDRGFVRLGGVDAATLPPEARPVAWVPQDGFLFARSVLENLRLGAPDADASALNTALRVAQATDVGSPSQILGPGGAPLSGGERQRLALARALLLDRAILALDEPTAHVDPSTEAAIVAALHGWRGTHTIVVATHDLRLAQAADRVVVLDHGRIVEDGAPVVLSAAGGAFSRWGAA